MSGSRQTLAEPERRAVAGWAAECAEHVLPIFEAAAPTDARPRDLIARARAYARATDDGTAAGIRDRFVGGVPAAEMPNQAAGAAARSAGQASAVVHMGAHALGAAGYAVVARELDEPADDGAGDREVAWQLSRMTPQVRAALASLPAAGTDRRGPLGPGLLTTGRVGHAVRRIQAGLGVG